MGSLRDLLDKNKAKIAASQPAAPIVAAPSVPIPPPLPIVPPVPQPAPKPLTMAERMRARTSAAQTAKTAEAGKPNGHGVGSGNAVIPPIPPSPNPVPPADVKIEPVVPAIVADLPDPILAEIKTNIQFLSDHIEEKELVSQMVRKIMQQMRANPHFRTFLTDSDKENIVRGFRRSYNVAARKKIEGGEKRAKKRDEIDEVDKIMSDLGFADLKM